MNSYNNGLNKKMVYCLKKIVHAFLLLFALIIFSLSSIFSWILICNEHYCYYEKCYKNNFDEKMNCFFDQTNNFSNWSLLDLMFGGYILAIIFTMLTMRMLYTKIIKLFAGRDYNHNYNYGHHKLSTNSKILNKKKSYKNYVLRLESLKESLDESIDEELVDESMDEEALKIDDNNLLLFV